MRNYLLLAMPLPLALPAAPTPSYCQCQDFTFNKCCKSLKNKKLPPPFSARLRSFSTTQRLDDRFADARRLGKTTVPRGRTAEIAGAVG